MKKYFLMLMVLIALSLGVLVTGWPHQYMNLILHVTRFFEVMLPVLAVTALLKYLCWCPGKKSAE